MKNYSFNLVKIQLKAKKKFVKNFSIYEDFEEFSILVGFWNTRL